jgi:hypothetical protein
MNPWKGNVAPAFFPALLVGAAAVAVPAGLALLYDSAPSNQTRITVVHSDPSQVERFADTVSVAVGDPATGLDLAKMPPANLDWQANISVPTISDFTLSLSYWKEGELIARHTVPVEPSQREVSIRVMGNPVGPIAFVETGAGFQMIQQNQQSFLKGVGFDYTRLDQNAQGQWFKYVDPMIANLGANAIRTYGIPWADGNVNTPGSPAYQAKDTSDMLAFAAQHNIKVLVGVFVDGSATNARVQQFIHLVQQDPNFSSVLGYCVGNEVALNLFPRVEQLVQLTKAQMTTPAQVRPVMTALPVVNAEFVPTVNQQIPSIDWLGINNFYGCYGNVCGGGYLNHQAAWLQQAGFKKPWAITEYYTYDLYAQDMPGQVLNGGNRYLLELNSTLNAQNYANSYTQYISSPSAMQAGCVGGFMLNFGPPHNSKLVASWLEPMTYTGPFTPFVNPPWNNGADKYFTLQAVDAIAQVYGGTVGPPGPQIVLGADQDLQGISCTWKATTTSPGQKLVPGQQGVTATVSASSALGLTFQWYLIGGSADGFSGDITGAGTNPQSYIAATSFFVGNGSTTQQGQVQTNTITFTVPNTTHLTNNYQLRVIVSDPNKKAATAVVGFAIGTPTASEGLAWRNNTSQASVVWFLQNGTVSSSANLGIPPSTVWVPSATGDVSGNGVSDLIWRNSQTGAIVIWFLDQNQHLISTASPGTVADASWQMVDAADANGDGTADILWFNTTTKLMVQWLLSPSGSVLQSRVIGTGPKGWSPRAARSINGSPIADILWQSSGATTQVAIWFMNSSGAVTSSRITGPAITSDWQLRTCARVFAAEQSAIFQHAGDGNVFYWRLATDGSLIATGSLGHISPEVWTAFGGCRF